MLRAHLRSMRAAERAIARAAELYAQQGQEEMFSASIELFNRAHVAADVVELAIEAASRRAE